MTVPLISGKPVQRFGRDTERRNEGFESGDTQGRNEGSGPSLPGVRDPPRWNVLPVHPAGLIRRPQRGGIHPNLLHLHQHLHLPGEHYSQTQEPVRPLQAESGYDVTA